MEFSEVVGGVDRFFEGFRFILNFIKLKLLIYFMVRGLGGSVILGLDWEGCICKRRGEVWSIWRLFVSFFF